LTSAIEIIVADSWHSSKMEIAIHASLAVASLVVALLVIALLVVVSLVVASLTDVELDKCVGFLPLIIVACLEHNLHLLVSYVVLVEEQT